MKIRRDWTDQTGRLSTINLELLAESLKERIYASLALLAVLLTIDPKHSTALHAAVIIGGTALSLWLASLVSSQMARRMVFGQPDAKQFEEDQQRHSPLLASAILPLLLVGLSALNIMSLERAVMISIWTILLALIGWSLASARSMHASRLATFLLAGFSLLIGLASSPSRHCCTDRGLVLVAVRPGKNTWAHGNVPWRLSLSPRQLQDR